MQVGIRLCGVADGKGGWVVATRSDHLCGSANNEGDLMLISAACAVGSMLKLRSRLHPGSGLVDVEGGVDMNNWFTCVVKHYLLAQVLCSS